MAVLTSCGGSGNSNTGAAIPLSYAKLLKVEQYDSYRLVTVSDPWKAGAVLHRYALVPRENVEPSDLPSEVTVLRVPLKNLCVSTSVHAALMYKLGALDYAGSICEGKYILTPAVRAQIKSGRIRDVGSGLNPNVEMIAELRTEALLMSPFEGASYGLLEKTGIPIVECADYMEASALGRAEWMKFYGMLVGREAEADSLFSEVANNYEILRSKVQTSDSKCPKLLADMLNGSTWYLPGGSSVYGVLYKDAGADFSIASPGAKGSQPLSLEKILLEARDADVWIIKYSRQQDYTYASLFQENSVYGDFSAFRQRRVFGCNTMFVPFYEEAPFRPDWLLGDIVSVLHPELTPGYQRMFYKELKN